MDKVRGWEPKMMRQLFWFTRKSEETIAQYCTRTARMARTILEKTKLLCLHAIVAQTMWRAMGWVCGQRPNAVLETLRHVFLRWRGTCWWKMETQVEMAQSRERLGQADFRMGRSRRMDGKHNMCGTCETS